MNDVKLIYQEHCFLWWMCNEYSYTPDAEKHMNLKPYCARVSNPSNQDNEKFSGLLKYCVKHQHWSIFEQAYMTQIELS